MTVCADITGRVRRFVQTSIFEYWISLPNDSTILELGFLETKLSLPEANTACELDSRAVL
jgi:hypothetical protein